MSIYDHVLVVKRRSNTIYAVNEAETVDTLFGRLDVWGGAC